MQIAYNKNRAFRYRWIQVGAGTSGCVIASRLSEMSNVSVLLVEAGGHFGWLSTMPLLAPMMQGTEVDWAYKTEPQAFSSRGLNEYVIKAPIFDSFSSCEKEGQKKETEERFL